MLRLIVLALILINGVYFGWASGGLRAYGFAPDQQNEPQRLAQQIKPEAIGFLTPEALKLAESQRQAEMVPKECLQAGPFNDTQLSVVRRALEDILPPQVWQLNTVQEPARWIVYMGKYPNAQALTKKRTELVGMHLSVEPVTNPALELGLSLGAFETQALANTELVRLTERGIRTARVVQEHEERKISLLKLPAVTDAIKARLADLKPALAGKSLKSCS
jgi:hypothetical protein